MDASAPTSAGLRLESVVLTRRASAGALRPVLSGITASFHPGEISLIRGATGSGKTTLISLLAGLLRPTEGVVWADGEPVSRWVTAARDRWRRQVGLSFQEPRLLAGMTALENLYLPALPRARDMAPLRERSLASLERVGAACLAGRQVSELSGGERQRVSLARSLSGSPRFLLWDEPTSAQDDEGAALALAAAEQAKAEGAVVVIASHDDRVSSSGSPDQVFLLSEGRLEERA